MKTYKLAIENNDIVETINSFFRKLFHENVIDMLLAYSHAPSGEALIKTLIYNEDNVKTVNPFAPLLMMNSARIVSQLTTDILDKKIGTVMRPCEIRAAVELSKLKQINRDNLIVIGVDCLGTYELDVFREIMREFKDIKKLTKTFLSQSSEGIPKEIKSNDVRLACRGCGYPNPLNADISIHFIGCDTEKEIVIQCSEKVSFKNPEKFGLQDNQDISQWKKVSEHAQQKRLQVQDNLFKEVLSMTKNLRSLLKELEHCRRCYNCRKECPICYCRECIFDSRTFEYESEHYVKLAEKKGKIRMPSDTLLFHLTRLNHMAISCVACGQCTSACPNNVPVAKIFKTIGHNVQKLFDYIPGKNWDEEIPQSTFKEKEFSEIGK